MARADGGARRRSASAPRSRWRTRLLLVLLAAVAGASGWLAWAVLERPVGNPPTVEIQVPRGTGLAEIVSILEANGLAPHPDVLRFLLLASGSGTRIQAGLHDLPGDANALDLVDLLARPARAEEVVLKLVPGESIWEAAARIEEAGLATREEVLRLAAVRPDDLPVGPDRPPRTDGVETTWLEGFLYPDTYRFRPDAGAGEVVRRTTARFREVWGGLVLRRRSDLLALRASHGLEPWQLVVLASLVEEEAREPSEQAIVAGVFLNRIEKGMRLQTDPTLMYHPDRVGRAPGPPERKDASNPYNTYAHDGLPPGPIASPGRSALEAVLAPERHDFLFFVADRSGNGRHVFSRTWEEHRDRVRGSAGGGEGATAPRP